MYMMYGTQMTFFRNVWHAKHWIHDQFQVPSILLQNYNQKCVAHHQTSKYSQVLSDVCYIISYHFLVKLDALKNCKSWRKSAHGIVQTSWHRTPSYPTQSKLSGAVNPAVGGWLPKLWVGLRGKTVLTFNQTSWGANVQPSPPKKR